MLKKSRIIIGMLLVLALLLPMIPAQVYAAQVEPAEYYGRRALEELPNNTALLYAYDQIAAGVENASASISVYDGKHPLSKAELEIAVDAYRRDYTHHFWLGNQYGYSLNSTTVLNVSPVYTMTGDALAAARVKFEAAADAILAGITPSMTEYEKELYIHDAIAKFAYYQEGTNAHSAYGALVDGITVCEGYAEAFQYLLRRAGIQSFIVIGTGNGGPHAWNMVRIDGEYYHVDLTWNDGDTNIFHSYFNVTDSMILQDHTIDSTAYIMPKCTSTSAFYYKVSGNYLDSYTVESVAKLLQDNDLQVSVYFPGEVSTLVDWYYSNIGQIATAVGVRTGFSYGYSYAGKEVVLKISNLDVKVTTGQSVSYYKSISGALNSCTNGAELKLLKDVSVNLNTSLQMSLDLNGYDINGSVNAANLVIYDSQTADYTINDENGYGVITGTVTGATAAEGYIKLTEGGTSYHKVDVALDKMVLKAESTGLYYIGSFLYDEIVAESLQAYGVTVSTENEMPVADDTDRASLYTTSGNSVLIKNIFSDGNTVTENRANAKEKIHARAYIKLQDGTIIYSNAKTSNLKTMVETVDANAFLRLSSSQKSALLQMYNKFAEEMSTWNITNLKNA